MDLFQEIYIFSVKELNSQIKEILAQAFPSILLEGEISRITKHHSGNIYLTLKDEESVIDAVIFSNYYKEEYNSLKEGSKILVKGTLLLNIKSGRYNFQIKDLKIRGKGELYEKFLQLKEKLERQGLFEPQTKKPLPAFPQTVGVITSPDGAAIKDFLTVSARRYPSANILIFPCLVQGKEEAVQSVLNAIEKARIYKDKFDVLVIMRGGGAYEELALFNEERIALAIHNFPIPTVSAIGHERDYTILDFTVDKRAATPSEAAEIIFPDQEELFETLEYYKKNMDNHISHKITLLEQELLFYQPYKLEEKINHKIHLQELALDYYYDKIDSIIQQKIQNKEKELSLLFQRLEKTNPLYILSKNYSLVYHSNGKIVKSIEEIKEKDILLIQIKDGKINAEVQKILKNP